MANYTKRKEYSEEKIIEDYLKLQSFRKVAKLHGVGKTTIEKILIRNNIERIKIPDRNIKNIDKIIEEYKKGSSFHKIKKKYGITNEYFKKILQSKNIELKKNNSVYKTIFESNKLDILNFLNDGKSILKLSRIYNIPDATLNAMINDHLNFKKSEKYIKYSELDEKEMANKFYDMYVNQGLYIENIRKITGCHFNYIKNLLIKFYGKNIIKPKDQICKEVSKKLENRKKSLKSLFSTKPYVLPSGKEIRVMGYENHFLDFVFNNTKLKEEDFDFNVKIVKMPNDRRYFPDFYIPKLNLIIEIKSNYTLNLHLNKNIENKTECKKQGYNFLFVIDKNYKVFSRYLKRNFLLR